MADTTLHAPLPDKDKRRGSNSPWWRRIFSTQGHILPYLLILPALLLLIVSIVFPLLFSFDISLTDANLLRFDNREYIGFENYTRMLNRDAFWESVYLTAIYTFGTVILSYGMGLFTALLLNTEFRFRGLARTLLVIPWATPWLVVTLIWFVMFNPQIGPVNQFLKILGVLDVGKSWLYESDSAMGAIVVVTSWRLFPAATLIILAGLQSIPPSLYEAAQVDGASGWQRFRYITLPSIRVVSLTVITLLTIWSSKLFTIAWTLTQGSDATRVLSVYTYQQAFSSNRLGRGSTLAMLSLILSLVLVLIYFYLIQREERRNTA